MEVTKNLEVGVESNSVVERRWKILNLVLRSFGDRRVSHLSVLRDDVWDFRTEGLSYRINFRALVGASDGDCLPLIILLKIVAYCMLKEYALIDRAPRTVYNILYASKPLIRLLVERKCLIADRQGGWFSLPRNISPDVLLDYIGEVGSSKLHENTKHDRVRFLLEWWKNSRDEQKLPDFMKLESDPFEGRKLKDFKGFSSSQNECSPDEDGDDSGWQAIPLEYAFPIANAAIEYIEKFSEPLIRYHQVINEGILASQASVSRGAVARECAALGIEVDDLASGLPFELRFNKYWPPSHPSKFTYRLERKEAERCISHIKRAAITVIFFTTGLRNREARELEVGCCVPDISQGVDDFYRLTLVVKKTSKEYYQGQVVSLPVPKITYLAVKVLEKLGTLTRRDNVLISPLQSNERSDHVSSQVTTTTIINYVKAFAKDVGVGYEPHPHQFRKTIAGWFVLNSPVLGPLLVMRLFSHNSIAMTEMYLKNNPLIVKARQEILLEQSLKIVKGIGESAQSGKLAGVIGERIKDSLNEDPLFKGLTGDVLGATMEEYLRERAKHGNMHFLLTPMAVCVFDPSDQTSKPCAKTVPVTNLGCEDTSSGLPLVSNCVGVSCNHCLMTKCQAPLIEQSLSFYNDLLSGAIDEDYARNLHIIDSARQFVGSYSPVLELIR
ncbi:MULTISPECIES: site-specific integrase [Pseudomonas]|uniref:site-specific integrase n=1 Tax=Pseudomonas TaxID=286 RepID=UPI0014707BD0|nr:MULTISPECIES: site-specific integrase [Pseudomonas]KAF4559924.1 site-specific integrase [Pseudomonas sp. CES]MDH0042805.1 site-specific integrase [Pseudomonas juntendi]